MKILKIYLNGSDATRFLEIKNQLNYSKNSDILKTLVVNFTRTLRKLQKDVDEDIEENEFKPKYGEECNPDEMDGKKKGDMIGSNKRTKKLDKIKLEGEPLQIKIRLSNREAKTIDEVSKERKKTHCKVVKEITQEFIKKYSGEPIEPESESIVTIRKKWAKSEKSKKIG